MNMAPRRHLAQVQGLVGDEVTGGVTRCCVPTGECLRAQQHMNNNDHMLISLDDLRDTVRVTCNNELCTSGRYMHRECFDQWEQSVLSYLKTCGRARSWSERQRHQNLWTKKGYDLAYKACGCKCGRGHLKKDLDWMPPPPTSNIFGRIEEVDSGKKKKRKNKNSRPTLAITSNHPIGSEIRARTGSLSCSSTGSSSPPTSGSEPSVSPIHAHSKKKSKVDLQDRIRQRSIVTKYGKQKKAKSEMET
uniref:Headcase protein-like isoform X2 n=1 Tax=Diabrotica virgifera virgifera TaxID=50390 RepID=A0A6P7F3S0_DIAVI